MRLIAFGDKTRKSTCEICKKEFIGDVRNVVAQLRIHYKCIHNCKVPKKEVSTFIRNTLTDEIHI